MKDVKTVGIIGFGVMGAAIGLNAAANGYRVVYKELNDELVKSMYDKFVVKPLAKRVGQGEDDPGGYGQNLRDDQRHHDLR